MTVRRRVTRTISESLPGPRNEEFRQRWFNRDVMQILKQHRSFDPEGLFLGDASYLFVPDNSNYEDSVRMLFDEHNHPVRCGSAKTH